MLRLSALGVLGMMLASAGGAEVVERWGRFELALTGAKKHENPFTEVSLTCRFECGGKAVAAHGFYDGENTWKVRFMPTGEGRWTYRTQSNDPGLNGKTGAFQCGPPSEGNHGPVVIRNTYHFAYADATPYYPVGTTLYNWIHREESLQEQTLATLRRHAFNRVRFCAFPKWYRYNRVEPPLYPWPRKGRNGFDRDRFNPAYFRHIERRVEDLLRMGIEADIILFHPYDRWGHSRMTAAQDDAYLKYAVSRLAPYRNVWWTMANEYDLMRAKSMADWDRFFQLVRQFDPYGHPRSNHNCRRWYDHSKPWVTHCNIQAGGGDLYEIAVRAREKYGKPVVIDEYGYEGDIPQGWGNRSPEEETHRHWGAALAGGYASHGETYYNKEEKLWWAVGGKLVGKSPARLAFLRKIVEAAPYEQMAPDPTLSPGDYVLCKPGAYYLIYFPRGDPATLVLPGTTPYKVDSIDTWNMAVTAVGTARPGKFTFTPPRARTLLRLSLYQRGEALRPEAKASATPTEGVAPLKVRFTANAGLKCRWDFGDGTRSGEPSPTHTYRKSGLYTVTLTVTDKAGATASTQLLIAVDSGSDTPIVGVGLKDGDNPPVKLHGKIKRGKDGSFDLAGGPPWRWISVGEGPLEILEGLRSLTILGWVNASSLEMGRGGNRIAFNLNYNRSGFDLVCLRDGRLRLSVNEWPDRVRNDSSPGKIPLGQWTFFAVAYDGTKTKDNVRWYFGNAGTPAELDRTTTYPRGATGRGSGTLTIGNYNETIHRHGVDRQFRGRIRGVAIFGSRLSPRGALSLKQIRKHQEKDGKNRD